MCQTTDSPRSSSSTAGMASPTSAGLGHPHGRGEGPDGGFIEGLLGADMGNRFWELPISGE